MNYHTLILTIKDRIAFLTVNRPDKLNALNAQCKSELKEVFTYLKTYQGVDVVILTGTGEKAFVAGTDISELRSLGTSTGKEFASGGQAIFDLIQHLGKPVLAAVNGYALGGGCELALACHMRIASENARFGLPEVNLGIIPGYGGTQRLSRLVGTGRATELILTGNQIDAQEARRIGLVNAVVPLADLLKTAESLARTITGKGQLAVRMALRAVNSGVDMALQDGLKLEAATFGECCGTEDFQEGISAFLEKRKPVFKGR